ncbi:MAG: uroporphyrinogen-III C-methyltransferase [Armatimonadetes bacterium]|nr:uroporphyrinogen-III C-methyltransferase [Armatimonadota bacterium]
MSNEAKNCGFVCIVGAGPGDPGLLTLKARSYLEQADVIVYDRLVTTSILSFAHPKAELIYAGKDPQSESTSQKWVNDVLISKALEGKFVVRLKNGDPLVFGRGAEEVEALVNAGIPFEIVPGVSSAFAVPAYAGIPLTDRRFSSSFVVTVGRNSPLNESRQRASLKELAIADTVVVLMSVGELEKIVQKLLEGGRAPQTPAAMIEWGTTSRQKVVATNLGELVSAAKDHNIQPPSVLVVGEVARLREKMAWYERKPLFGKRIAITCVDEQDQKLAQLLEELGAELVRLSILCAENESLIWTKSKVDKNSFQDCNWLIFGCPHSVEAFFDFARSESVDLRTFSQAKFAAFGWRTAETLGKFCIFPEIVLSEGNPVELNAELLLKSVNGWKVNYLRFSIWHGCRVLTDLSENLRKLGAEVSEIWINEVEFLPKDFLKALLREPVDIFVLTHPCAVYRFASSKFHPNLRGSNLFVVGDDTAKAIQRTKFASDFEIKAQILDYTQDGRIRSLVIEGLFAKEKSCQLKFICVKFKPFFSTDQKGLR